MCLACDLAAGLGTVATKNKLQGKATSSTPTAGLGRRRFVCGALACASIGLDAVAGIVPVKPAKAASNRSADTVFQNGAVYTVAANQPWAEAVAVGDGRILAVGTSDDVRRFIGPQTDVIDLHGQMLMPGFVEGHTHPFLGAFFAAGVDLQYPTRAEALQALREYAALNPTGSLRGFGWRMDLPTAVRRGRSSIKSFQTVRHCSSRSIATVCG